MGLAFWSVLLDSSATWTKLEYKVLRLTSDHKQIISVSKRMFTTFISPKKSLMIDKTRQERDQMKEVEKIKNRRIFHNIW